MVDNDNVNNPNNSSDGSASEGQAPKRRGSRRAASRPAGPPVSVTETAPAAVEAPTEVAAPVESGDAPAKAAPRKRAPRKAKPVESGASDAQAVDVDVVDVDVDVPAVEAVEKPKRGRGRGRGKAADVSVEAPVDVIAEPVVEEESAPVKRGRGRTRPAAFAVAFVAPEEVAATEDEELVEELSGEELAIDGEILDAEVVEEADADDSEAGEPEEESGGSRNARRRRRRGGRGRKSADERSAAHAQDADQASETGDSSDSEESDGEEADGEDSEESQDDSEGSRSSRRRRRRRRRGSDSGDAVTGDDPPNTVVKVREPRTEPASTQRGSTRLEAKKQRRREGREQGRRRTSILTESEFLARREAVDRVMIVRQQGDKTQIAVLEDKVLVEHYVNKASSSSMVGNVYMGRVQNVLPSMEAAFVDLGRGRNAVLYAGEVNWDAAGLDGQPRRIEFALKAGDPVLVQVTKDPMGHKGARLTSQISLPGRFLVYVPDGSMTGISRKLPENERNRLKSILKKVMPEEAGVIVRTAAEGATEEELIADVTRLAEAWETIAAKAASANPPTLLYGEPDLATKVVRDIFNEDVRQLIVSGAEAWSTINDYVTGVAPDLADRLSLWTGTGDVFAAHRVDEQLTKALDRKVWLPSGGSLVIDRTEAMTVVDVNTGKFTGSGGNLEETVTKNNLEAAEEIVRQLRLRDIGGIVVIDFIDMVLASNRDLVLRRLVECLGRDRTKHQVAEVTSLGLVQMTRKRIGQGLLEVFSTSCDACNGRGVHVSLHDGTPVPIEATEEPTPKAPKKTSPAKPTPPKKQRGKPSGVDPAVVAARALAAKVDGDEEPAVEAEIEVSETPTAADLNVFIEPEPALDLFTDLVDEDVADSFVDTGDSV